MNETVMIRDTVKGVVKGLTIVVEFHLQSRFDIRRIALFVLVHNSKTLIQVVN